MNLVHHKKDGAYSSLSVYPEVYHIQVWWSIIAWTQRQHSPEV